MPCKGNHTCCNRDEFSRTLFPCDAAVISKQSELEHWKERAELAERKLELLMKAVKECSKDLE